MAKLSRRHLLGTGAAIAAGTTLRASVAYATSGPVHLEAISPAGLAILNALRELRERWYAADSYASNLECKSGAPGYSDYRAAEKKAKAIWKENEAAHAKIAAAPLRTFDDVVVCMEAARLSNGTLEFELYDARDEHAELP